MYRLGFVSLLFCLTWFSSAPARGAERPNILLIVADDLGYSDLGCYGGEIATPRLDALAEAGLRLTRFYNTGRCCPSRASILSGQYPHRVGLGHMVQDLQQPGYRGRISDDARTIAEVAAGAGYRTFLSGKWHLGTQDPTRRGFEEFYGTLVSAKTFWDPDHFLRLPADRKKRQYKPSEFYGTDALTDHALDFLKLARGTPNKPWLLYLAYNAPHFPLQAPPEDIARYADKYHVGWDQLRRRRLARMKKLGIVPQSTRLTPRSQYWDWGEEHTDHNPAWSSLPQERRADLARRMAIYAAMVDRLDQNVGRVVDDLHAAGELDNTLIVFLSDNGACAEWDPLGFDNQSGPENILHTGDELASMGQAGTFHSAGSGWANVSNTPWRLYKHYNHEGGINSPCIVHWPAGMKRRAEIDHHAAHIIDLMPTIVEVSGAKYDSPLPLPGESLTPLLRGESPAPRTLYFEHEGNRAVLQDKWKLVARKGAPWELYDTTRDRTELDDLAKDHPQQVERLAELWDAWAEANDVTPAPDDYGVGYLRPAGAEK
ncbi:MAG: arylsulfatase [Pirellulaceae bacterium]